MCPLLYTNTNPINNFIEELKSKLSNKLLNCLFICSDPNDYERTDMYGYYTKSTFEEAGFCFQNFYILDTRNKDLLNKLLENTNVVILAGGHVPTQNKFFNEIKLKEHLDKFNGVIIGVSAGSMNSAKIVYAHPERDGEAISKEYKKFLPGLGITKNMIIPHYNCIKDTVLDGLRVFEDIAYPDSMEHKFYVLMDGSYIYGHDGIEELHGEAYLIQNGIIKKINETNQTILLP